MAVIHLVRWLHFRKFSHLKTHQGDGRNNYSHNETVHSSCPEAPPPSLPTYRAVRAALLRLPMFPSSKSECIMRFLFLSLFPDSSQRLSLADTMVFPRNAPVSSMQLLASLYCWTCLTFLDPTSKSHVLFLFLFPPPPSFSHFSLPLPLLHLHPLGNGWNLLLPVLLFLSRTLPKWS